MTPEASQALIAVEPDPADVERVRALAGRSNQGTLTSEERAEYEMYVLAGDLIAVLKAKTRAVLSRS